MKIKQKHQQNKNESLNMWTAYLIAYATLALKVALIHAFPDKPYPPPNSDLTAFAKFAADPAVSPCDNFYNASVGSWTGTADNSSSIYEGFKGPLDMVKTNGRGAQISEMLNVTASAVISSTDPLVVAKRYLQTCLKNYHDPEKNFLDFLNAIKKKYTQKTNGKVVTSFNYSSIADRNLALTMATSDSVTTFLIKLVVDSGVKNAFIYSLNLNPAWYDLDYDYPREDVFARKEVIGNISTLYNLGFSSEVINDINNLEYQFSVCGTSFSSSYAPEAKYNYSKIDSTSAFDPNAIVALYGLKVQNVIFGDNGPFMDCQIKSMSKLGLSPQRSATLFYSYILYRYTVTFGKNVFQPPNFMELYNTAASSILGLDPLPAKSSSQICFKLVSGIFAAPLELAWYAKYVLNTTVNSKAYNKSTADIDKYLSGQFNQIKETFKDQIEEWGGPSTFVTKTKLRNRFQDVVDDFKYLSPFIITKSKRDYPTSINITKPFWQTHLEAISLRATVLLGKVGKNIKSTDYPFADYGIKDWMMNCRIVQPKLSLLVPPFFTPSTLKLNNKNILTALYLAVPVVWNVVDPYMGLPLNSDGTLEKVYGLYGQNSNPFFAPVINAFMFYTRSAYNTMKTQKLYPWTNITDWDQTKLITPNNPTTFQGNYAILLDLIKKVGDESSIKTMDILTAFALAKGARETPETLNTYYLSSNYFPPELAVNEILRATKAYKNYYYGEGGCVFGNRTRSVMVPYDQSL